MVRRVTKSWKVLKKINRAAIVSLYKALSENDDPENYEIDIIYDKLHYGYKDDEMPEVIESSSKDRNGKFSNYFFCENN